MAEIGAQLREARTRARIEIAQMEAQTKIRAKYLRALENEEWELLPGPTYVKSFLRTYGDMLGLDGRQLVTDYKNAHEPFQAEGELGQMSKHTGGRMNRQQSRPALPRVAGLALLLVAVVGGGGYYLTTRGDDGADPSPIAQGDGTGATGEDGATGAGTGTATTRRAVRVVLTATAPVTVCARAGRRIVVKETELRSGEKTERINGRSVIVMVRNRSVQLTVDGERQALPAGRAPLTLAITDAGVRRAGADVSACRV